MQDDSDLGKSAAVGPRLSGYNRTLMRQNRRPDDDQGYAHTAVAVTRVNVCRIPTGVREKLDTRNPTVHRERPERWDEHLHRLSEETYAYDPQALQHYSDI